VLGTAVRPCQYIGGESIVGDLGTTGEPGPPERANGINRTAQNHLIGLQLNPQYQLNYQVK